MTPFLTVGLLPATNSCPYPKFYLDASRGLKEDFRWEELTQTNTHTHHHTHHSSLITVLTIRLRSVSVIRTGNGPVVVRASRDGRRAAPFMRCSPLLPFSGSSRVARRSLAGRCLQNAGHGDVCILAISGAHYQPRPSCHHRGRRLPGCILPFLEMETRASPRPATPPASTHLQAR